MDLGGDPIRFAGDGIEDRQLRLNRPSRAHRDEPLVNLFFDLQAVRIVAPDEPIGAIKNRLAGPEILRQDDPPHVLVVLQKLQDVADGGTTPLVNRVMHDNSIGNKIMCFFYF